MVNLQAKSAIRMEFAEMVLIELTFWAVWVVFFFFFFFFFSCYGLVAGGGGGSYGYGCDYG